MSLTRMVLGLVGLVAVPVVLVVIGVFVAISASPSGGCGGG